eukprot:GFUD01098162.1.p1 GENE.GFUD01098162.1~~GFUD01098162.1.p1  ORF type:complete len:430 (-),score=100.07 GFUD01098162.1:62-1351(-)
MRDIFIKCCILLALFFPPGAVSSNAKCCSTILLDAEDPEHDIHILHGSRLGFYKQMGWYGDHAQYKQLDGENYVFYSKTESMWITTPHHVGNTTTGIISKNTTTKCANSLLDWQYFNGTEFQHDRNLKSTCAEIEDTCCKHIEMSSPTINKPQDNSSSVVYTEEAKKTLGRYTAVGTTNGRYVYQHDGMSRYLEFDESNQNWLVVQGIGHTSGFIYHSGGSVCAENSGNRWHAASYDEKTKTNDWVHDGDFQVLCVDDEDKLEETSSKTESQIKVTTTTTIETTTNATKSTTTTIGTTTNATKSTTTAASTKILSTETPTISSTTITDAEPASNVSRSSPGKTETTTPLSVEEETAVSVDKQGNPQADPLIAETEDSGSAVTPVVVSLLFLVVFSMLAVFLVRRFRKSWRNGSQGRQLVMETIGLYRDI